MAVDETPSATDPSTVLTKAALRAAERLGIDDASLARIIGASAAAIPAYRYGETVLAPATPEGGRALLLIRVLLALDALVGANVVQRLAWMTSANTALGGVPVQVIQQPGGLVSTLAYLELYAEGASPPQIDGRNM